MISKCKTLVFFLELRVMLLKECVAIGFQSNFLSAR